MLEMQPKPTTMYELFEQDVWWKDNDGNWQVIDLLDKYYRMNMLRFLRARATRYYFAAHRALLFSSLMMVEDPSDGVWMAQQSAEAPFIRFSPKEWVEHTALVRKLREVEENWTSLDEFNLKMENNSFKIRKLLRCTSSST
jgi:hypothetical protein